MVFTEHVKIREEKFGTVIFETLKEKVFVTNRPGRDILRLIQENKTLDDIIEVLENKYDDSQIRADVINFINELKKNEILVA